jgi:hypothetical protein
MTPPATHAPTHPEVLGRFTRPGGKAEDWWRVAAATPGSDCRPDGPGRDDPAGAVHALAETSLRGRRGRLTAALSAPELLPQFDGDGDVLHQ